MTVTPIRDEAHWHALRSKHVGASEVAALFGVQPAYAMSAFTLWQVKAGRVPPPEVTGARPAWGRRLEAVVAEAVAETNGWRVENVTDYHDHDGLGATLDFAAWKPDSASPGALEVKNVDWLAHRRAWTGHEPPLAIILQLQSQLAVTGWTWGAVACLIGGNELAIYEYDRRPKVIAEIAARVAAFWTAISEDKPPPPDGTDSTSATLNALFPMADAEPLDLSADNEAPDLCARYLHAGVARREAEAAEKAARNAILAKVGLHARATCNGFRIGAPAIAATPDRTVTADMIGTVIKGRAGYRRINVAEVSE